MLTGCSLHHVDRSPAAGIDAPAQWPAPTTEGSETAAPGTKPWWRAFSDSKLDELIDRSLSGSPELAVAVARLEQADAVLKNRRAARLPGLSAEASASSRSGEIFFLSEQADVGVTLGWELDVFNRLGAMALAARMTAAARADDVAATRLLLSTRVADAYYLAVEQHQQLALLENQIEVNTQLLTVTQARFEAGIANALDVLQQRSQLEAARALLPLVRADVYDVENQLDVLIGMAPDGADRVSAEDVFADVSSPFDAGVPSELLLARPDLRALKNELVAADAEIARAVAERLPRVTLTGSAVYAVSGDFSGLATTALASLFQPLFEWGARRAEVERNRALYEERLSRFAQAYLDAMVEVENALYAERQLADHLERLEERRKILEESLTRARELYDQGLTDYLSVLNAIRELQQVERELLSRRRQWVGTRIELNRAVGGSTVADPQES